MSETNDAGWRVDDSTFRARLALIRHRMGWNMKRAARECGLPAATWRTWEVDGAEPHNRIEVAEKIAARTGCDFGWLLDPRLGRDTLVARLGGEDRSVRRPKGGSARATDRPMPARTDQRKATLVGSPMVGPVGHSRQAPPVVSGRPARTAVPLTSSAA